MKSKFGKYANKKLFNWIHEEVDLVNLVRQCMVRMHMMICNDSGLMHIADAIKVPLITIFGATYASKNAPYRKFWVRNVYSFAGCAPCQYTNQWMLCNDYECIRMITPSDIFAQMLSLIDEVGYKFK